MTRFNLIFNKKKKETFNTSPTKMSGDQMTQQNHSNNNGGGGGDMKKSFNKLPDFPGFSPMGITRERSFVRMSTAANHPQNVNKRRSLAFNHPQHQQQQQQQMRGKPALEIYRPPSNYLIHLLFCMRILSLCGICTDKCFSFLY